jgi:hypothetical protein
VAAAPSLTTRSALWYFPDVSLRALGQWLAIIVVLTLLFGEMLRVRRKQLRSPPVAPVGQTVPAGNAPR